jgi:threonine dehydratase
MGCTIARSAAKRATFESLTMSADSEPVSRIECKLDGDPRLIAGASAIVAHVARRAGLSAAAAAEIAGAASAACAAVFQAIGGGKSSAAITLAVAEFSDRVEATIEPSPEDLKALRASPSAGRPAGFAEQIRQRLKGAALDGLNAESRDGIPRVTLVKNCGAAKRPFVV